VGVRRQDFAYELPEELIAQTPLAERSASRLLVLDRVSEAIADRTVRDLPSYLRSGDLLVFNDTRVVAARLVGSKSSGGRVEIFLERALAGRAALAQLRASKPVRDGSEVATTGGTVRVLGREDDLWRIELPAPALEFFEQWGEVPLPPYIHRAAEATDRERYQSIFARERGAVAAPTASLHFDAPLMAQMEARGVGCAFVTLHVGAGTFQPVRADDLESHTLHAERVSVSAATCEAVERTRSAGGRVIAVGETRLFIRPGFHFQVIDLLLTNFHLPESTLLMLVCAFAGRERVLAAYAHAVRARYRFFSYGDAMFITSAGRAGVRP